jgi:hypothetical protein
VTASTLSLSWTDFINAVATRLGYGYESDPPNYTKWSADEYTELNGFVNTGYRYVLIRKGQEGGRWSFSRVPTSIIAWADTTGTVSGDAVYADPSSTITATAASFHPAMTSHDFVFGTSGTGYNITSVTSTTVCVVTGDASTEATGDTFTITADGDYDLPDDFAAMCGPMTFEETDGTMAVQMRAEQDIRTMRMATMADSRPRHGATRWKAGTGAAQQRAELLLWPVPDGDYTLYYSYDVAPVKLDSTNLYPLGGLHMGEAVKAAAIYAAAKHHGEATDADWGDFQAALTAAIQADAQSVRADNLGRSSGWSRSVGTSRAGMRYDSGIQATYNGGVSEP